MVRLKEQRKGVKELCDKFQFHYGTIKRQGTEERQGLFAYFNSTMVRLKERSKVININECKVFQFHYGTIKRS